MATVTRELSRELMVVASTGWFKAKVPNRTAKIWRAASKVDSYDVAKTPSLFIIGPWTSTAMNFKQRSVVAQTKDRYFISFWKFEAATMTR